MRLVKGKEIRQQQRDQQPPSSSRIKKAKEEKREKLHKHTMQTIKRELIIRVKSFVIPSKSL